MQGQSRGLCGALLGWGKAAWRGEVERGLADALPQGGLLMVLAAVGAEGEEEEELVPEEPGCAQAARQEARTAAGLSNAIRAWHAAHKGANNWGFANHPVAPCSLP